MSISKEGSNNRPRNIRDGVKKMKMSVYGDKMLSIAMTREDVRRARVGKEITS